MSDHQVRLTEAAQAMGWSYWRARDALLTGLLRGGRDPSGRYWVESSSLDELVAERQDALQLAAEPESPPDRG